MAIREKAAAAAILATALTAHACGTCWNVIHGRTAQEIPVTSSPVGAKVLVDGKDRGVTPLTLRIAPTRRRVVRIECDGYAPHEIRIVRKTNPWASLWGNLVLGSMITFLTVPNALEEDGRAETLATVLAVPAAGIFGLVDYASGALSTYDPESLEVALTPADGSPKVAVTEIDASDIKSIKWIRIRLAGVRSPPPAP